mmetsp:Transcript_21280/g.59936  ORF Transcript_21280/g.59936 Transcript_21280/m.59936 type:complete len:203 (-) Transcript_21280:92-700(-)
MTGRTLRRTGRRGVGRWRTIRTIWSHPRYWHPRHPRRSSRACSSSTRRSGAARKRRRRRRKPRRRKNRKRKPRRSAPWPSQRIRTRGSAPYPRPNERALQACRLSQTETLMRIFRASTLLGRCPLRRKSRHLLSPVTPTTTTTTTMIRGRRKKRTTLKETPTRFLSNNAVFPLRLYQHGIRKKAEVIPTTRFFFSNFTIARK